MYDSAIAVAGATIAAVGPTDEVLAQFPEAEVVNGRRKAVFPGLVNCHTHLLATADRGILEDFGFPTTLRFPVSTRSLLSPEERQVIASLGALEALRSGTTTLLEISDRVGEYAETLADTGMRLVLADNFNDVDPVKLTAGGLRVPGILAGLRAWPAAGSWWIGGTSPAMAGLPVFSHPMHRKPALPNCCGRCGNWPRRRESGIRSTCRKAGRRLKR